MYSFPIQPLLLRREIVHGYYSRSLVRLKLVLEYSVPCGLKGILLRERKDETWPLDV